jgi:hypothetical protein
MKIPITIKTAGLIALFPKGFFALKLPFLAIEPPDGGCEYISRHRISSGPNVPWGEVCILHKKDPNSAV